MHKNVYENIFSTRKSSCVNARGIPPAAQQVHAMLFWKGVPPCLGRQNPPLGRQYPPTWEGSTPTQEGSTTLSLGRGYPPLPGKGYPHQEGSTPPAHLGRQYPPSAGWWYPPTPAMVDKVKTLPSVILRMRAVKVSRCAHSAE